MQQVSRLLNVQRLICNLPDQAPVRGLGDQNQRVAQLEFRDAFQRTPLCCAARQNNVPLVQLVRVYRSMLRDA